MSSESENKNGCGVWVASGALVAILLTVVFGGAIWQWMTVKPKEAGTNEPMVHSQTLMQPVSFADATAMQATLGMLPGRSVSEAMGLLRLPATSVMVYPDSTACYTIAVKSPTSGMLKVTAEHGQVTAATFEKE